MKGKKLADAQQEYGFKVICTVCGKSAEGFYARYGDGGACSKKCMNEMDAKPRYPGHEESDFLKRLEVT